MPVPCRHAISSLDTAVSCDHLSVNPQTKRIVPSFSSLCPAPFHHLVSSLHPAPFHHPISSLRPAPFHHPISSLCPAPFSPSNQYWHKCCYHNICTQLKDKMQFGPLCMSAVFLVLQPFPYFIHSVCLSFFSFLHVHFVIDLFSYLKAKCNILL